MTDVSQGPLAGRTLLVTGASRGVGAAIARRAAQGGARVLLHYSANRAAAEAIAAEIGAPPGDLLHADLGDDGAGAALFAAARTAAGRIDALILNAAIAESTPLDRPETDWRAAFRRTLEVNLVACADIARAALADFASNGGGTLVAIASRAAQRGDTPDFMAYAASKGGLVAMMKTIARYYAHAGVRAYTIAPGWIETDMAPTDPELRVRAVAEIPLGRMAEPDEIARLCAFLVSDACPSATGATFDVNGASYVR
jgi:NAD(P)-dependent dehydrogenase (short-subunit alcohol dehydrogenase family)